MGIKGRVALVTGGGRGIGRAVAERLAADGHTVVVAARSESELATVVEAIRAGGGRAAGHPVEIRDRDSVDALVREVTRTHGPTEVLVNSAGTSYIGPVLLGDPEQWRYVLEVNLLGALLISRAVLRPMLSARWGRIIHIGSISSQVGAPYNAVYAASKAGIDGLVRSLALEVARSGVTVNTVAPGYVRTELFAQTQSKRAKLKGVSLEKQEADLIADTPIGRFVEPADVAAAVGFLASDAADSITGQVINVDGGRTAR